MGNPFKDQFLKKGLVTKKQAKKISHEQRLSGPKKRNKKTQDSDGMQRRVQQNLQVQSTRERELNRQHNEAAKEKEIQGQIRQIIGQNRLDAKGDISFHFVDGKKIKRLYLSKKIADGLSKGEMAIVKQDEEYVVVTAKAASQIQDRKAEALILLNSPASQQMDADDPYAEFPIPDDYDW